MKKLTVLLLLFTCLQEIMAGDVKGRVTDKETGERLVNINTISQLIYNGTKYIVD